MALDMGRTTQQARRSALYVPGSNRRALEKAKSLNADVLILDLEDSVSPTRKDEARRAVLDSVALGDYPGKELVIRVNGIGTPWHTDDLSAVAASNPAGILVPKVESPGEVLMLSEILDRCGSSSSLWLMIETPRAIRYIYEIAEASVRTDALVFGTNDFVAELGARHVKGRAPLASALGTTVMAARASGIMAFDGVFNDVGDESGFEAECVQSRDFGFDGKTLIHPSQVEPTNSVFTPSAESVEEANEIIAAFEIASRAGSGVATAKGRMIEALHVREAERTLRLAGSATSKDRQE
jgi:citrate lyase subunit beta/citryl-CoA lyase